MASRNLLKLDIKTEFEELSAFNWKTISLFSQWEQRNQQRYGMAENHNWET